MCFSSPRLTLAQRLRVASASAPRCSWSRTENGEYDYEALEAIDLELFNDHLRRLMAGESIDIPRYDFITGRGARNQYHPRSAP